MTTGIPKLAQALYEEAELIMGISKEEYVPVMDGTLRATGHVKPPVIAGPTIEVTLGYGGPAAPYALSVHENPRSGHTEGVSPQGRPYKRWAKVGGWKYLEIPVSQAMPGLVSRIGLTLQEIMR